MNKSNEMPPTIDSLASKVLAILAKPTNISKVETIGDTWNDDHILCVAVRVTTTDGSEHRIGLWWCGPQIAAAAEYAASSRRAFTTITQYIAENAQAALGAEGGNR